MSELNTNIEQYIERKNYPYKELLENFTEAIYVISLQGLFIDYNHGFSTLVGPGDRYLNTNFLDLVHPHDLELAKSGFVETLEGKVLKEERLRIFAEDGQEKTIITSKVPLLGKDGELLGILGIAKDITVEIKLHCQIQQQNNRFKSLLTNSSTVNSILSPSGEVLYRSPSVEKVLGYKPNELEGPIFNIIHPDDVVMVRERISHLLSHPDEPQDLDVRIRHKNGQWRMFHVISNNLVEDPDINGIVINYHDVTEIRQAQHKIHHMAYHDYLTGLPNRRLFEERLEEELLEAKRKNSQLAVLFLDIDRFKFINDTLGHNIGDQVLKKIKHILLNLVSAKDVVARMAGDEFLILAPAVANVGYAKTLAANILQKLEAPIIIDHYELYVTGSIGITIYPDSGQELSALMKNSDLAMYAAKNSKSNSYQVFTPAMEKTSFKQFTLQNELRKAIVNNEFELYYQPKVNSKTRQIVGAEALIRWNHPTKGILSPFEFIPLAEETGLIVPLGEWVLQTVCKQVKMWEHNGFPPIIVSLNFSALQMLQKGLVDTVASILREHQVKGTSIEIEITESLILNHDSDLVEKLEALKALGIHIAIDDFGTGYSSLSYLRKYKFNTIKLDRSFINDIHTSLDNQAIIQFVIQLSNQLKMKVVAEGVELEEQLALLQQMNCDEIQGYLFSKPTPVGEFEKLLGKRGDGSCASTKV
ncbi:sensor domain-containing protein [Halalkalibacter akibai]|uniref:Diguanylate cyclase/phosphodiesterase n=1 Tax=Halalkalibacter akibai (strain ATCC 43226 / DSM 21942 / CIP 109018 / JCM 9157 / 1139) TaxID=1236973 RepID=W4QT09_HALA3|nr:bifunctional diguanylate cyclase/phosphodiesterase [Halalkalibacter akibai]GAE35032.1 diguanylate cyclase/phosphodiesterase [Halalkalibacter akibai JCM 9157]